VTKVQDFEFDIEYVKGKKNIVADTLSRRHAMCSLMEVSEDWKSHLLVEYSKNKFACEILDGQGSGRQVQGHRRRHLLQGPSLLSTRFRAQKEDLSSSPRLSISRSPGVFQNLQTDQREVLLEGPQTGCYEVHQ
jgi:hypothetical protein